MQELFHLPDLPPVWEKSNFYLEETETAWSLLAACRGGRLSLRQALPYVLRAEPLKEQLGCLTRFLGKERAHVRCQVLGCNALFSHTLSTPTRSGKKRDCGAQTKSWVGSLLLLVQAAVFGVRILAPFEKDSLEFDGDFEPLASLLTQQKFCFFFFCNATARQHCPHFPGCSQGKAIIW